MDFLELAEKRYSCRAFENTPVTQQQIDAILEAARLAPTACNFQPQRISVLKSEEALSKMRGLIKYHFNAPLIMIVSYDKNTSWKNPLDGHEFGPVDAAIAVTQMMLEIAELGLGTTYVGFFDSNVIKKEFELPDSFEPVAILPIGYPKEGNVPGPKHSQSISLEEMVHNI